MRLALWSPTCYLSSKSAVWQKAQSAVFELNASDICKSDLVFKLFIIWFFKLMTSENEISKCIGDLCQQTYNKIGKNFHLRFYRCKYKTIQINNKSVTK